jgi:hypothetical protein
MTFSANRVISCGWFVFELSISEETPKDLFINTLPCSKPTSCLIVFENYSLCEASKMYKIVIKDFKKYVRKICAGITKIQRK